MEPEKKSNGALIGLIIIVVILIVGGIYIWQSNNKLQEQTLPPDAITEEDTSALDTLDQDLEALDTDIGVDVDTIN